MEFSVSLTIHTVEPLSRTTIFDVAAIGGVVVGDSGGNQLETTLTVVAQNEAEAGDIAVREVTAICPGRASDVEVLTVSEFDRTWRLD